MTKKSLSIRENTIFDGLFTKYFLKSLFTLWFKLAGWKICERPPEGAGVAIAAPHTSNWDFIYALGAAVLQDVKIYFSIKDSLCKVPVLGTWLMWLGAMPIDRSSKGQGQVEQIKAFINSQKDKRVFFLFTPEGTRGAVSKWKTGFYHVAQGCKLPIFLAKVDYLSKEAGVFHTFKLTGDKEEDIQAIQASYTSIQGKHPKDQYPLYDGQLPAISEAEAAVIRALYSFKGVATKMEITAKAKLAELSSNMLTLLIEKGLLEKSEKTPESKETAYQLTFAGKGCFLHLSPTL
ncbi:MAG: lysophospholipid acyltransferase family protein [Colwellia sp.]|nr:lysophospholipid acyltransferase family protein [Colwellia sp.]MCW8865447.1 lysophospholipid acyltransferase family protein [Colwellia sp.]MCW9081998.1 lysophospholipid acyltransferase family protein [Colwellia sp.]